MTQSAVMERRRVTIDHPETIGVPLTPIGKRRDQGITRFAQVDWTIEQDVDAVAQLPTGVVYDVFYGLLFEWRRQGMPDDGIIRFSRYELLQTLGWVSAGRTPGGKANAKPSGRHYRTLADTCRALMRTLIYSTSRGRERGFNFVTHYDLVVDQVGRRKNGENLPLRSSATLNPEFVRMLKSAINLVELDLDTYLSLSTGMPRVLYRVLTFLRLVQREEVRLEELFARLGSIQASFVPAVSRKLIDSAIHELIARDVLRVPPEYRRDPGGWWIQFDLACPSRAREEDAAMLRESSAYGVERKTAARLLVAHRERFAEVLAWLASGNWGGVDSYAGAIVRWTQNPAWALPRKDASAQTLLLGSADDMYRDWCMVRTDTLVRNYRMNVGEMRREIVERRRVATGEEPQAWWTEGMLRIRLRAMLDLPPKIVWTTASKDLDEAFVPVA